MMVKIQKIYNPLYTSDKFIFILSGGRGGAKSFNSTLFTERLTFEKGHKILYSRYTMTSAQISVIPEFLEKIELEGTKEYFKVTNKEITNVFSGSEILFRGIKTSSGNQTANLKSINGLTTFVGDEMEEWESEDDYDKLMLSIRQKNIQNRIILILNPTDAEHWIYKKYIENTHKSVTIDGVDVQISTHPNVLHIHSTYLDNIENLSEQFLEEVQRIKQESIKQCTDGNGNFDKIAFRKSKYATKIIGRWMDVAEGVIYTNWREGEFDDSLPYGYGMDFGFSIDPDVLLKVAVDNKNKKIYIDEQYYNRGQLSTSQLYDMVKSRIKKPNDLIIADSAEPRLIADLAKTANGRVGLNIKECVKGQGSVSGGIYAISDFEIIVTAASNNVKKELKRYRWNDKKAGIPLDADNHAMDSLRYIFEKLAVNKKVKVNKNSIGFY